MPTATSLLGVFFLMGQCWEFADSVGGDEEGTWRLSGPEGESCRAARSGRRSAELDCSPVQLQTGLGCELCAASDSSITVMPLQPKWEQPGQT